MKFNHKDLGVLSGFFAGLSSPILFAAGVLPLQSIQNQSDADVDLKAMRSDWMAVGESFGIAIEKYQIGYGNTTQSPEQYASY